MKRAYQYYQCLLLHFNLLRFKFSGPNLVDNMYQSSSKILIGIATASANFLLFRSELYNNSVCALKQAFKKFVKLLTKKKITKDAHIEPYWKRCDVCRLKYEIIGKMETFDADSKVDGHLNPGLFNPKLQPGLFNP